MSRTLIAGCGYVGTALALQLMAQGHRVWGLRRTIEGLPDGLHGIAADLTQPDTLRDLPANLDTVVYTTSPSRGSGDAYRHAYVDGTRNLIEALRAQGQTPRRVIMTSSTGVYDQHEGEWVDETSPTTPTHTSGVQLLAGEQLLLEGPFQAVILRLAGIYGPGRTRYLRQVQAGEAVCYNDHTLYSNRIHRDDCAGALAHLMTLKDPDAVYIGVDHAPADRTVVTRWLAQQLQVPDPPLQPYASATRRRSRSHTPCRNDPLVASASTFRAPTHRECHPPLID